MRTFYTASNATYTGNQCAEDIDHDEPFIDVSPQHVQRIVKTVAEQTAERTGTDDFPAASEVGEISV